MYNKNRIIYWIQYTCKLKIKDYFILNLYAINNLPKPEYFKTF